jgi:hypothetical protein
VPAAAYADAPALSYRPVSRELTTLPTSLGPLTAAPFWRLQVEDERLFAALALAATYNSRWREQVAPRLANRGTWIAWGAPPEAVAGAYRPASTASRSTPAWPARRPACWRRPSPTRRCTRSPRTA